MRWNTSDSSIDCSSVICESIPSGPEVLDIPKDLIIGSIDQER